MGQIYEVVVTIHNNNERSTNKAQGSRKDRAGNPGQVRKDYTGDRTLNLIKMEEGVGGPAESTAKERQELSMGRV